jgi:hypothetical protein
MKIETMKNLGLLLVAIGVMSMIVGTYITYSSLSDYTQFAIAPAAACEVTGQVYSQFLWRQNVGGSVFFYGLALTIVGAIFYSSAQVKRVGATVREVSSDVPKT